MADQIPSSKNSSDEIDLGQLLKLIGNGFNNIFRGFLRMFIYLKANLVILLGLIILGLAIGYGLNQFSTVQLKTEVIVKPQIDSKNYLYSVIGEIQAKIKARDSVFFKSIGIEKIDFKGLDVSISPVDDNKESTESELKYLELLQSFENTNTIADIVRAELQNKSSFDHRITFFYKNVEHGQHFANKIIEYINANTYFDGLIKIYRENASGRIQENQVLLKQVDKIIANYTEGLASSNGGALSERIILDNQEQVNIADLFEYKNRLIQDIESKKLEVERQTTPISIINFGKPQRVQKAFFGKNIVLIPSVFLIIFFLISFLRFLNKKSKELSN